MWQRTLVLVVSAKSIQSSTRYARILALIAIADLRSGLEALGAVFLDIESEASRWSPCHAIR